MIHHHHHQNRDKKPCKQTQRAGPPSPKARQSVCTRPRTWMYICPGQTCDALRCEAMRCDAVRDMTRHTHTTSPPEYIPPVSRPAKYLPYQSPIYVCTYPRNQAPRAGRRREKAIGAIVVMISSPCLALPCHALPLPLPIRRSPSDVSPHSLTSCHPPDSKRREPSARRSRLSRHGHGHVTWRRQLRCNTATACSPRSSWC